MPVQVKENTPNQKGTRMSYIVFDTETTSLDKPFCYDVGYAIFSDDHIEQVRRHFIIEQTWHNLPLFESAYYHDKRPLYVKLMRSKKAIMDKWGYVMLAMKRDIREYNVTAAYAYNSDFDDKVFTFNCDWFKCNNPLEDIPIYDIWGYVSQFISNTDKYKAFCEQHQYLTDTGNYKASAEIVYKYITDQTDFEEAHMGLYDVDIEAQILHHCFSLGAKNETTYKVVKVLPRLVEKPFTVKVNNEIVYKGMYIKKYVRDGLYSFTTLKG